MIVALVIKIYWVVNYYLMLYVSVFAEKYFYPCLIFLSKARVVVAPLEKAISFRCDQNHYNHCYILVNTLLSCLSPT
jgi:hypothetical protein